MNINNGGGYKNKIKLLAIKHAIFQMKTLIIVSIITFKNYVTEYDDVDEWYYNSLYAC